MGQSFIMSLYYKNMLLRLIKMSDKWDSIYLSQGLTIKNKSIKQLYLFFLGQNTA
jgi:hypothetical protein